MVFSNHSLIKSFFSSLFSFLHLYSLSSYWSKGEMEALFLEHEGYFGALGAFLMSQNIEKRNGGFYQWETNP